MHVHKRMEHTKLLSMLESGSPLTGRVRAKSHPFKKMKREIAAVVVLCAACVEGANRLDGHKGKHSAPGKMIHGIGAVS
jgi:hypothetical protein